MRMPICAPLIWGVRGRKIAHFLRRCAIFRAIAYYHICTHYLIGASVHFFWVGKRNEPKKSPLLPNQLRMAKDSPTLLSPASIIFMALYTAYPCYYLTDQACPLLFVGWPWLSYLRHYKAPSYTRVLVFYTSGRRERI